MTSVKPRPSTTSTHIPLVNPPRPIYIHRKPVAHFDRLNIIRKKQTLAGIGDADQFRGRMPAPAGRLRVTDQDHREYPWVNHIRPIAGITQVGNSDHHAEVEALVAVVGDGVGDEGGDE